MNPRFASLISAGKSSILLAVLLSCFSTLALADTLTVPVGSQSVDKQHVERPTTGTAGKSVVAEFGEPLAVNAPVGEPPISRWEYESFYVYFEYDRVIRSVLK